MIADELNKLRQTKAQIKQALIDKGQNPSDDFASYAVEIGGISSSSSANNAEVHFTSEFDGDITKVIFDPTCEFPILFVDTQNTEIHTANWQLPKAKKLESFPTVIKGSSISGGRTDSTIVFNVPNLEEASGLWLNDSWGLTINCTNKLTNIDYMLNRSCGCREFTITDTSNIKSARYAFYAVKNDFEISLPNLEYAQYMFYNSSSRYTSYLANYTLNDITKPFEASSMFYMGKQIQNVFSNTTWKVKSCTQMFSSCNKLLSIPEIDFEYATEARYTFDNCTLLTEVRIKNTQNLTSITGMFSASGITNVPENLDTSNVTNMDYLFSGCKNLTYIPKLNVSKASLSDFINNSGVIKIEELEINEDAISSNYQAFKIGTCSTLRYALLKGLGIRGINKYASSSYIKADLSQLTNWGVEDETIPLSAGARQSVVDTLLTYSYDRVGNGKTTKYTFQLSANTKALLTEEEIAQITAKGYTIA